MLVIYAVKPPLASISHNISAPTCCAHADWVMLGFPLSSVYLLTWRGITCKPSCRFGVHCVSQQNAAKNAGQGSNLLDSRSFLVEEALPHKNYESGVKCAFIRVRFVRDSQSSQIGF